MKTRKILSLCTFCLMVITSPSISFGENWTFKGSVTKENPGSFWNYWIYRIKSNKPLASDNLLYDGFVEINTVDTTQNQCKNSATHSGHFQTVSAPVSETADIIEKRYTASGTVSGDLNGIMVASHVEYTIQDGPSQFVGITLGRADWECQGYVGTTYYYYRLDPVLGNTFYSGSMEGDIHGEYHSAGYDGSGNIINQVAMMSVDGIENIGTFNIVWDNPILYIENAPVSHTDVAFISQELDAITTPSGCLSETTVKDSGDFLSVPSLNIGFSTGLWTVNGTDISGSSYSYAYLKSTTSDIAPRLIGLTQDGAEDILGTQLFAVGNITNSHSDTIPAGRVVSQSVSAGSLISHGTYIDIVISSGPLMITVPSVVGMEENEAENALIAASLTIGSFNAVHDASVPLAHIISQSPDAGTLVLPGASIDLTTSLGPQPANVIVPNVIRLERSYAEGDIRAATLSVGDITEDFDPVVPEGHVISQSPEAGAVVTPNAPVHLTISLGPIPGGVEVPNVVGFTQENAGTMLTTAGLTLGTVNTVFDGAPVGQVLAQDPEAGAFVDEGTTVSLTVSGGPETVSVPDVTGMNLTDLTDILVGTDLQTGTVSYEYSSTITPGCCIRSVPAAGSTVARNTLVDIILSQASPMITVPNVIGLQLSGEGSAESLLTEAGLVIGTVTRLVSTTPVGQVLSQFPEAGTVVEQNIPINLSVACRPELVSVPDVTGLNMTEIASLLIQYGLQGVFLNYEVSDVIPPYCAISSVPAAGSQVEMGSLVGLILAAPPVMVQVPDVVGLLRAEAEAGIIESGLALGTVTQIFDNAPVGQVISQYPEPAGTVIEHTLVDLTVSLGPEMVAVPDITGKTLFEIAVLLSDSGLTAGTQIYEPHPTIPPFCGISSIPPAGTMVPKNTIVDLILSQAPVTVPVPNIVGIERLVAESIIIENQLALGTVSEVYNEAPAGQVIGQDPVAGQNVTTMTMVNLTVSLGPELVSVPDLSNQDLFTISSVIASVGLRTGTLIYEYSATVPPYYCIRTVPAAGTSIPKDSIVDLVLSQGPQKIAVPSVTGLDRTAAESALSGSGLTVGTVQESYNNSRPVGEVLTQSPAANSLVDYGSSVDLVISKGPEGGVTIPDMRGMAFWDIYSQCATLGLIVGNIEFQSSSEVPLYSVIRTVPAAGTIVPKNTSVNFVVSLGQ